MFKSKIDKKLIVIIFLMILNFNNIFADISSGGVFSNTSVSNSIGNNFDLGNDNNSNYHSTSSNQGPSGTTINVNNSLPQINGNFEQPKILGNDSQYQKNQLITNYKKDEFYNGYSNLLGQKNEMQSSNGQIISSLIDAFQANVQIRTGLLLNKYGYNLFYNQNTFFPTENIPPSKDYILGAGDEVFIRAWGALDIAYNAKIDNEGAIFIPKIGKIPLIGIKIADLDNYLKDRIGRLYKNFSLSATVSIIRSIQINVTGFAKKPGTYTVSSLSALTDVIFAAHGPSEDGSLREIQLKRNGKVIVNYDMYDLFLRGNNNNNIHLLPGDIIYFKPYGKEVAIYDGVKVPGIYEIKEGETIADLINLAGGYSYDNTKQQIIVEKIEKNQKINVYNYDLKIGASQKLEDGEIVHFFKMQNSYQDAIVLIGNIANPSRYNWKKGIKVSDIIPNKEMLLTKSFWNSYNYNTYSRDLLLDQFGKEKTNNWGNATNEQNSLFSSGLNNTSIQDNKNVFSGGDNLFIAGPIAIPEADINWHFATIVRIDKQTYRSILIPFDLEAAINKDNINNIELEPGDIINILSSKDVRSPSRKGALYVFIDGEINRPGVYELKPNDKLLDAIKIAGGLSSDAYLYGLELDRQSVKKRQKAALNQMLDNIQQSLLSQANDFTTSAISQDQVILKNQILSQQQIFINKLRQLKPSGRIVLGLSSDQLDLAHIPNIILENGDTIYIPPIPSTIDVIGQVYNPATFVYDNKYSINDYLDKAGTPNNFADTSSIYVLHADGTLYSKQQVGLFGYFGSKKLFAGDSIIVPQKIQFSTITKNLVDWTQILANFGLGIAAIKILGN